MVFKSHLLFRSELINRRSIFYVCLPGVSGIDGQQGHGAFMFKSHMRWFLFRTLGWLSRDCMIILSLDDSHVEIKFCNNGFWKLCFIVNKATQRFI